MTHRSRQLAFLIAVLPIALCSFGLKAETVPVYSDRLIMPVAEDDIRHASSVTADPHTGEVFVTDTEGQRILIFDSAGLFRYQISGGGLFQAPQDVAIDPEGLILVLAYGGTPGSLFELDFDGLFLREITISNLPEGLRTPAIASMALAANGEDLLVLDGANSMLLFLSREGIFKHSVDLKEKLSERESRDLMLGTVKVYGDTVLVSMASLGQVWCFDLDGERCGAFGLKGTSPCKLGFPTAAALTADGKLIVVDQQRMIIQLWSVRENRCLGDYYGIGTAPGFFYFPFDLALDSKGRLYVAQGFEGRVQVYEGLAPAAGTELDPE